MDGERLVVEVSGVRETALEVRPTVAEVDLHALAHNLQIVRQHVGSGVKVLAVVKADAYGHGAIAAARALVDAGAWGLAVSLVEEGVELREAGIHAPVLVLGGVHPGSEDVLVHRRLRPVIWTREHLARLGAAVARSGAHPLPVHVKVDTGMSRLGLLPADLPGVLEALVADRGRTLWLEGMMTHLACADDPEDDSSAHQIEQFTACTRAAIEHGQAPTLLHVSNSAGLVRLPHAHFDMVRPGIALYGAGSSPAVALPGLRMAMRVRSKILGVRSLPRGTRVSYGGRERLERDSKLAIVPVGYGDGYPRRVSGRAQMLIRGHRCRVVGAVTMDVCMVDVTDLPDAREGEEVVILGRQGRERIDVHELAGWAEVLPYEITCGISKRVPRK